MPPYHRELQILRLERDALRQALDRIKATLYTTSLSHQAIVHMMRATLKSVDDVGYDLPGTESEHLATRPGHNGSSRPG